MCGKDRVPSDLGKPGEQTGLFQGENLPRCQAGSEAWGRARLHLMKHEEAAWEEDGDTGEVSEKPRVMQGGDLPTAGRRPGSLSLRRRKKGARLSYW